MKKLSITSLLLLAAGTASADVSFEGYVGDLRHVFVRTVILCDLEFDEGSPTLMRFSEQSGHVEYWMLHQVLSLPQQSEFVAAQQSDTGSNPELALGVSE